MLAGVGLFVLPVKRRQARRDFHARSEELQSRLMTVMREQFDHELNRSMGRIEEAVAPYTRFVRSSQGEMERMRDDLTGIRNELASLRHVIGGAASRRSGSWAGGVNRPAGAHDR